LILLAQVVHEQGLSATVLSDETIRRALARLEVGWKRAKRWLTSPIPTTRVKKSPRPPDPAGAKPAGLGARLPGRGLVLPPGAAGAACLDGGRAPAPWPAPPWIAPILSRRPWPATACGCLHASGRCCASSTGDRSAR